MRKIERKIMDQREIQKDMLTVLKKRVINLLPIAQNPQPIKAMNVYLTYSINDYNNNKNKVKIMEHVGFLNRKNLLKSSEFKAVTIDK